MASWEKWIPELTLAAPSAPVPLMELCLNRAAREFLRRTRAWQEWLEPQATDGKPLTEYDFDLPPGAELLRLERATKNGAELTVANGRDVARDTSVHGAAFLISANLRTFRVGAPAGNVQVYVSLIPVIGARQLPDEVATLYHEAIGHGARAQLASTPSTDFFNPDQMAIAAAQFEQAITSAMTDVWRSNTGRVSRGRITWC